MNQATFEELAFTLDLIHIDAGLKSGSAPEAEELEQAVRAAMQLNRYDAG